MHQYSRRFMAQILNLFSARTIPTIHKGLAGNRRADDKFFQSKEAFRMYVNVSRSQSLINKMRYTQDTGKIPKKEPAPRCNHCGGLVRSSGEISSCIMCSRISGHHCDTCAYEHSA